jgi:hypothetical protein
MGTELVPYKSWGEFTSARRNMQEKCQRIGVRFGTVLAAFALVLSAIGWLSAHISNTIAVVLALTICGIFLFERIAGPRAIRRNRIADLPNIAIEFPCPHCFENYNLGHAWVCGWCKEKHNDWLPNWDKLPTPATGCNNGSCEETELHHLSGGKGDQAAVQCPNCHRHIVLDPVLYERAQCHLSPFEGVARFIGDTNEPVHPVPIRSVFPTAPGSPVEQVKSSGGRHGRFRGDV